MDLRLLGPELSKLGTGFEYRTFGNPELGGPGWAVQDAIQSRGARIAPLHPAHRALAGQPAGTLARRRVHTATYSQSNREPPLRSRISGCGVHLSARRVSYQ